MFWSLSQLKSCLLGPPTDATSHHAERQFQCAETEAYRGCRRRPTAFEMRQIIARQSRNNGPSHYTAETRLSGRPITGSELRMSDAAAAFSFRSGTPEFGRWQHG